MGMEFETVDTASDDGSRLSAPLPFIPAVRAISWYQDDN